LGGHKFRRRGGDLLVYRGVFTPEPQSLIAIDQPAFGRLSTHSGTDQGSIPTSVCRRFIRKLFAAFLKVAESAGDGGGVCFNGTDRVQCGLWIFEDLPASYEQDFAESPEHPVVLGSAAHVLDSALSQDRNRFGQIDGWNGRRKVSDTASANLWTAAGH
jgi:hypothetical protein